jgi:hypothetical protein
MRNLRAAAQTMAPLILNVATQPVAEAKGSVVRARSQRRAAPMGSVPEGGDQLLCESLNSSVARAGVEAVYQENQEQDQVRLRQRCQ